MNHWIKKATDNLLKYSHSKENFSTAKQEWYITGHVIDSLDDFLNEDLRPSCELCEHEDLRWQFEIKNKINEKYLLVGSSCIKQFDIALIGTNDQLIIGEERNSEIDILIRKKLEDKKFNDLLEILRALWKKDVSFRQKIEGIAKKWKDDKFFTPNMASLIVWRLKHNKINHKNNLFKVSLKKKEYKNQIKEMEDWKVTQLLDYLTATQKQIVKKIISG